MTPNRNYQRGRAFEYEIVKRCLALEPLYACRSAGSHSLFDVTSLVPRNLDSRWGDMHLIQAKVAGKRKPESLREEWLEEIGKLVIPKLAVVKPQLWVKTKDGIIAWGRT